MSERTDDELDEVFGAAYDAQVETLPSGAQVIGVHCDTAGYRSLYNLGLADARAAHAAEVEGLRAALQACVRAMRLWGAEEDGIPEGGPIAEAYDGAVRLLANPETTRKNDE